VRKFFAFAIFTILVMGIVPTFAQDAEPANIVELVTSLAQADEPELTSLLSAIQAADPIIAETLSNPDLSFTVFAPSDAAFQALSDLLGAPIFEFDVLGNPATIGNLLLYHVTEGAIDAETLGFLDGQDVPTLLANEELSFAIDADSNVTVNDSLIVTQDFMVGNSIVHVIDAVLLPESVDLGRNDIDDPTTTNVFTIAELVTDSAQMAEGAQFTTLLTAIQAADPAVLELLSDPNAQLTVFLPLDSGFDALRESLGDEAFNGILADQETLTNILLYHVVKGRIDGETMLLFDGQAADSRLDGASIGISLVNASMESPMGIQLNESVNILVADIQTRNGVIYVIDSVLVPPAE